ncbi:ABC transporter permease [Clostridium nigeriense]|uniref:ABC transporter permease n=1 Tax=Clostridium nigeriense TaxID=1805470 RepID=UPI000829CCF3|nr:ABC transporter permease [Clostridium nigeriense]
MVLFSLIKKEIIHFFRNKSNVVTMFIFPVILIVIMGFSLNGLMNVDTNIFENKKVYYKINDFNIENNYLQLFKSFKHNCEEELRIEFQEINEENYGKDSVNKYEALAFISINEDKYDFYRNENKEDSSQKIFRSIFKQYLESYSVTNIALEKNSNILKEIKESEVIVEDQGISNEGISSFAYYTFAELVLIIVYISQITSVSTYNEGVEKTYLRLKVSKASEFTIILSKLILGIVVGILQILIVYFVSTVFLNINWGENIREIIAVLIALIIFSSILGITIGYVFKDSKAASSVINISLIVLGLLGGCYLPISLIKSNMITSLLCKITPTYWANISLLSLSSGIKTNYSIISIVLSLELSLILLIICIFSNSFKVGDKLA